jgi:hypothetical protein
MTSRSPFQSLSHGDEDRVATKPFPQVALSGAPKNSLGSGVPIPATAVYPMPMNAGPAREAAKAAKANGLSRERHWRHILIFNI